MSIRAYEMMFAAFGLDLQDRGSRLEGTCPACGTEKKLNIPKEPTKSADGSAYYPFRCPKCNWSGNTLSMMYRLYSELPPGSTTATDWKNLSQRRHGLDPEIPMLNGVRRLPSGQWAFPSFVSPERQTAKLAFWDERPFLKDGKPKCKPIIWPADHYGYWEFGSVAGADAVVLTDGYWDGWAVRQLLDLDPSILDKLAEKSLGSVAVLALPGANGFQKEWKKYLKGKDVFFSLDDDKPDKMGKIASEEAFSRTATMLMPYVNRVFKLDWGLYKDALKLYQPKTTVLESIKDVNDCFKHSWTPDQMADSWSKSLQLTSLEPTPDSIKCDNLPDLLAHLRNYITTNPHTERTFVLCLAIVLAAHYEELNPLWVHLYAPSGTGKTTLLDCFKKSEYVHCEDAFRATAFASGYRPQAGEEKVSLFDKVKGKCMILGEWTVNMTASAEEQARTNGVLRRLYEGEFAQTYGNGQEVNCEGRFGLLAAVTDEIKKRRTAHLGERFYRIDLCSSPNGFSDNPDAEEEIEHILRAMDNTSRGLEWTRAKKIVQLATADYLRHLVDRWREEPPVPQSFRRRLAYIAQVTEMLRFQVDRNEHDDVSETARAGVGTRVGTQFLRTMSNVAAVLGKEAGDEECWQYIQRAATDSMSSQPYKVCRLLYGFGRRPWIDRYKVANYLQVSPPTASKILRDLLEIRVVKHETRKNRAGAHTEGVWALTEKFANYWQGAKMEPIDLFIDDEDVLAGATREPDTIEVLEDLVVEMDLPIVIPAPRVEKPAKAKAAGPITKITFQKAKPAEPMNGHTNGHAPKAVAPAPSPTPTPKKLVFVGKKTKP